ncbi:HAMP domain-containing protein [Lentzea tibetensis]|uniref:histidine kinase n=1 Tax=Lentzea tibetensis TaxID=2591470 RepID=A0A563EG79_9PSEU|nr:ATP-binding protein [Lentzea tibetensis]TWP45225.1 HAMP domain-containing protein [Lentzea tibetensis]
MRSSLLVRLLVSSVLVAVCSIAATAWLVVQGTSGAIRQQQGQAIASDQEIYDVLLDHAGTRPIWDAKTEEVIAELTRKTGRRITLTSDSRVHVAGYRLDPLPLKASARIDPLNVDPALRPGGPIDDRLAGPFRLSDAESEALKKSAELRRDCLATNGIGAVLVETPSRRWLVETPGRQTGSTPSRCGEITAGTIVTPVDTESAALADLQRIFATCALKEPPLLVNAAGVPVLSPKSQGGEKAEKCLLESRRQQLDQYAAPSALLFVSNDDGAPEIGLTRAGTTPIVLAALAVLLLTVLVSFLVATRLVEPLKALTGAAKQMRAGDTQARVRTKARGEIGEVADAFNEMAEHLDRTERQRKAMISDVSHELRTPVGNIRGWLIATQDGVADLDQELVGSLLEETLLLQHLVDDLQQLALADADQLQLHREQINAADVLDQFAGHDRVTVRRAPQLDLDADPVRLRQVVGNLVTNALRHSENEVVVSGERRNGQVVIEVADTGTGIAEEDLPHVFDRFWRADSSRSRQTGGSGLGLAIVRNLVELHGGTVEVRSRLGAGTTFTLKLPA